MIKVDVKHCKAHWLLKIRKKRGNIVKEMTAFPIISAKCDESKIKFEIADVFLNFEHLKIIIQLGHFLLFICPP